MYRVQIIIINMLSIIGLRGLLVDVKMDYRQGTQIEMPLSETKENRLTWGIMKDKQVDQVMKGHTNLQTNTIYTTK